MRVGDGAPALPAAAPGSPTRGEGTGDQGEPVAHERATVRRMSSPGRLVVTSTVSASRPGRSTTSVGAVAVARRHRDQGVVPTGRGPDVPLTAECSRPVERPGGATTAEPRVAPARWRPAPTTRPDGSRAVSSGRAWSAAGRCGPAGGRSVERHLQPGRGRGRAAGVVVGGRGPVDRRRGRVVVRPSPVRRTHGDAPRRRPPRPHRHAAAASADGGPLAEGGSGRGSTTRVGGPALPARPGARVSRSTVMAGPPRRAGAQRCAAPWPAGS